MTTPRSEGVVRQWHDDEGWGVLDSDDTPGGCWVFFGEVRVAGLGKLIPGQRVEFEVQRMRQDGFDFAAANVAPMGDYAVPPRVPDPPSAAYRTTVEVTFDPE